MIEGLRLCNDYDLNIAGLISSGSELSSYYLLLAVLDWLPCFCSFCFICA